MSGTIATFIAIYFASQAFTWTWIMRKQHAGYLQALKQARAQETFAVYLQLRRAYSTSRSFYLDCAEFFRR